MGTLDLYLYTHTHMQIHNLASCLSKCIFFCVVLVLLEVL